MTQPAPLNTFAIEVLCDADNVDTHPFKRMTRGDTSVAIGQPPTLHGERHDFDLWACASKAATA